MLAGILVFVNYRVADLVTLWQSMPDLLDDAVEERPPEVSALPDR